MSLKIRINSAICWVAAVCLLFADFFSVYKGQWFYDSGYKMSSPYETQANICIWIAVCFSLFYCIRNYKQIKKIPVWAKVMMLFMVIASLTWSLISILDKDTIFTVVVRQYAPFMMVIPLVATAAQDNSIYHAFTKASKYLSVIFLAIALYFEITFMATYGFSMRSKSSGIQIFLWEGLMTWLFYTFNEYNKKTLDSKEKTSLIGCVLVVVTTLLSLSRSNIIIGMLCLLLYLRWIDPGHKHKFGAYGKFMALAIIFLMLFSYFLPESYSSIIDRLSNDTRSGQYVVFFEQVPLSSLLTGQGSGATYSFSRFSEFSYVDNANLVMAFRWGAVPVVCMLGLLFGCLPRAYKYKMDDCWQIVLIWLLATNGVSVYLNYRISFGYLLLWIQVGRILYHNRVGGVVYR